MIALIFPDCADCHDTGWFFLLVPPKKILHTKSLYNRQHIEKFQANLHGILNLGGTSKKNHPVALVCSEIPGVQKFWVLNNSAC